MSQNVICQIKNCKKIQFFTVIFLKKTGVNMNDLKKNLGKRLKEIRKDKKYTQKELAEKFGLSSRELIRIENGQTFPSSETLNRITSVLDIKIRDLFNFD